MDFDELVGKQRMYFRSGATRSRAFRLSMLRKLQAAIKNNEGLINTAMKQDLNKCADEVYMTETGLVLDELKYHLKHVTGWMKERTVRTPLVQFPSRSFVSPEPYGVTLIMSPWNYPVLLCLDPLIGAISAGCTSVVKPSAYTPATSAALARILGDIFPPEYIAVVEGGREQNSALLEEEFDYIFFTGSPSVGHLVMEKASKHLTPVTLELGGKSPVIVDGTADIPVAARRIAFGKVLNGGQTCVEPDYLFIHESVKDRFIAEYKKALVEFFPGGDMSTMNVIVNGRHFDRVKALLGSGTVVAGGQTDETRRFIAPTLLDNVSPDSPIMQEEIFGPILPIITYTDIETCISYVVGHPRPLALYLFTSDRRTEKRVLETCSFGGGCINDTVIHIATSDMPFGGVGASGMGSYHGKKSFDTFTHYRSIVKKATWFDLPVRYRPYTSLKRRLLRLFLN
ncbi:MAG TPA: aldehyde dehydrogenase family protein [Treponema sp.]|nr:aldehyde dehydrogenase family protein [Treponema sp.]